MVKFSILSLTQLANVTLVARIPLARRASNLGLIIFGSGS